MDKSVRNKWVKYLRSGKYSQTTGILQDDNGYCCLGVLCRLAEDSGITVPKEDGYYTCPEADYLIPEIVHKWADIHPLSKYGDGDRDFLYRNNDQDLMDFNAIADIIEREF